ncbi:hypothetical protein ACFLVZ_02880 [Chloroflexota bacterium]
MKRITIIASCLILILSTLLIIAGCKAIFPDEQISQKTARDFLISAPTFKFDGIKNSLKLTATNTLRSPNNWEFTYKFECSHSGYGDRSGQNLLQVITPHTAMIRVIQGKVVEAIIDNKWDELEQTLLETPPSPVPAAPNDSIVTAKVITTKKQPDGSMWEVTIEIQNSEDVPGFLNATKDKIGQQMTALTNEDVSWLKPDQLIKANVRLDGDEHIRFYYASDIH